MNTVLTVRLTRLHVVIALVAALLAASGAVAVAQSAVLAGKGVTQVKVSQFAQSDFEDNGQGQQDLPGVAPVTVTVPANQTALVKLTLAGESICLGGQGQAAACRTAFQFRRGNGPRQQIKLVAFDSSEASGLEQESHAMIATVGPLNPGTYTFFVQGAFSGADRLVLTAGEFIAERIAV